MTRIANAEQLATYDSYELAWLAPIFYPLSLAMAVLLILVMCCIRERRREGKPRHLVIDIVSGYVCLVEFFFTIFCLIQCCINFASRSYSGGEPACALQGWYSTTYAFASFASVVMALFCSYRILTTGVCSWKPRGVLIAIVLITVIAVLIGLLPVMGAGSYIFAVDYCMYNLEGLMYQIIWAIAYFVSLLCITFCMVMGYRNAVDPDARSKARWLWLFGLFWFIVWLPSIIIWGLAVAGDGPSTTDWWRIYGAHAIILHTQQLGNAILYGFVYRFLMHQYLDSTEDDELDFKNSKDVPMQIIAPFNTPYAVYPVPLGTAYAVPQAGYPMQPWDGYTPYSQKAPMYMSPY